MNATELGLLKGYDLTDLRERITTPPFDTIYRDLHARAGAAIEHDKQTDSIKAGGWCHSLYFTPQVLEAGFLYAMQEEQSAADHVARQINKLERVYADPPDSFYREINGKVGKPSAYFSNAHTCLAARMCQPGLTSETWTRLCDLARHRLIDDHHKPAYFFTHYNAGHNAVATHVISGAICALTFGHEVSHPQTEQIIEWGRDAVEAHLAHGFDDHGAPVEGPMYGIVTLEWVYLFAELLRQHGYENLFETMPKLAVLPQAFAELQLPGLAGYVGFDDCRRLIEQFPMPWLLLTAEHYDRPQDKALWHDTLLDHMDGHQNIKPVWLGLRELLWWDGQKPARKVTDYHLPLAYFSTWKNIAQMRTSWSADAVCLTVLGQGRSKNVPDHMHADAGHFCLYAHGDYLAYDTGYFNFDEDAHSVVLIDDQPFAPAQQSNYHHAHFTRTQHTDWIDCVSIDAASAKGCHWADRHVLFIRCGDDQAYTVIADSLNKDNQAHNYKWQLQANMHTRIDITSDHTASVIGDTARLDCHFFKPAPEDYPGNEHSLKVWADDHSHHNVLTKEPETNPRLVAELDGPNGTLLSLIMPRRLGAEPLTITDESGYRTWSIKVAHGDYVDQIVFAADHAWVRLADVKAQSTLLVVRRDQSGRVVASWSIDGSPVQAT